MRLCTFSQHPHWHPLRHLSRTYFQVLGSPREPVKLLKVLNRRELARSHSTTELLPPNFVSINDPVPTEQIWRLRRNLPPFGKLQIPHFFGMTNTKKEMTNH